MSISSLVVHVRPEKIDAARAAFDRLAGVEVHGASDDGRLVVTLDCPGERAAFETMTKLRDVDGVLTTSLVYSYFEDDSAGKEKAS